MTPGTVIFDGEELRWPLLHPSLAEKVRFFFEIFFCVIGRFDP